MSYPFLLKTTFRLYFILISPNELDCGGVFLRKDFFFFVVFFCLYCVIVSKKFDSSELEDYSSEDSLSD